MRLTCPACGACGSIEFFLMDAAARESVRAAFSLPAPLGRQVMSYIGLFRPGRRSLTWDRVEKLLAELLTCIQEAKVVRNGITHPAPLDYWKEAIDQVLMNRAKLTLPMKSHGYLFEVIAGLAVKAGAAKEQRVETRRRCGEGQRSGAGKPVAAIDMTKQSESYKAGSASLRDALKNTETECD